MWDTIQKLEYRARAGIADAEENLNRRLNDRVLLPLKGIHGEALYLTGMTKLSEKAQELELLYQKLPERRGVQEVLLLDAWSSATIEGARTTVAQVKKSFDHPSTKDDQMVVNTIAGADYAYRQEITPKNIRRLWEKIVKGVCENENQAGSRYRSGMVYVGSADRIIHAPAQADQLPQLMEDWFKFRQSNSPALLLNSFVAHFYFVYVHPFCDGNGRTARICNMSQLYHGGYKKMKSVPLSNAINNQLSGYYGSLSDSERILLDGGEKWLDLSPFVSYMLDVFERSLMDAALSTNVLGEQESRLLERMNKAGLNAEITVKKAAQILNLSESAARNVLNRLVSKGYLTVDTSRLPFLFQRK